MIKIKDPHETENLYKRIQELEAEVKELRLHVVIVESENRWLLAELEALDTAPMRGGV